MSTGRIEVARSGPRHPYNPFRSLPTHWHLIRVMVTRDVLSRYRGSMMGLFWSVISPLVMLCLYTFVFSVVLKVKFGANGSHTAFALYLFCGMLPWLAFSDGVTRATNSVVDNVNLVKKVVFPLEILPVNVVLSALVSETFGLVVFLCGLVVLTHQLPPTVLLLPLLLVPQLLLTLGISWLMAAIGVFVRDLSQLIGLLLTAWMFMTPIMFPESAIPQRLHWLANLNPLTVLVGAYRRVFLDGTVPAWRPLGYLLVLSCLVFMGGFRVFQKLKQGFADVL